MSSEPDLGKLLGQLQLRSLAFWGWYFLDPLLSWVLRTRWWSPLEWIAVRLCRSALCKLICKDLSAAQEPLYRASQSAHRMTLLSNPAGVAGSALFNFFENLTTLYDEYVINGEYHGAHFSRLDFLVESLDEAAQVLGKNPSIMKKQGAVLAQILLDLCGSKGTGETLLSHDLQEQILRKMRERSTENNPSM